MKKFFILVLLNAITIHFYKLTTISPLKTGSIFFRYFSSLSSIFSIFLLYKIVFYYSKNKKIASLSALIFSLLPWTIWEGRIASEVNISLSLILAILFLASKIHGIKKFFLLGIIPLIIYFFYPSFWPFRLSTNLRDSSLSDFVNNIFFLSSLETLFFKNPTFWWGGVRQWGISLSAFIPFFFIGFFTTIVQKNIKLIFILIGILLLASLSPFLPESREFYFATPIISYFVSKGMLTVCYALKHLKGGRNACLPAGRDSFQVKEFAIALFIFLFIYEYQNFLHYYMVHFPQNVKGHLYDIKGNF